ncbi:MAG: TPM domain-containing protein [Casimicrobiaceae bacterium]
MFLTNTETKAIEAQVAAIEARAGVQIVTAVIGRANAHGELPWKAFALGVAFAGLVAVAFDSRRPDWSSAYAALVHVLLILGGGALSAMAALFMPAYARLFLQVARRDAEVRRYAEALFLRRQLFHTRDRNGILLLVSRYERRVEIVADIGFDGRIGESEWRSVIARMTPLLAADATAKALQAGLARLDELLAAKGVHGVPAGGNELANRPIQERGAS